MLNPKGFREVSTFATPSPRLFLKEKGKETGAVLVAASIIAAIRLRASRSSRAPN